MDQSWCCYGMGNFNDLMTEFTNTKHNWSPAAWNLKLCRPLAKCCCLVGKNINIVLCWWHVADICKFKKLRKTKQWVTQHIPGVFALVVGQGTHYNKIFKKYEAMTTPPSPARALFTWKTKMPTPQHGLPLIWVVWVHCENLKKEPFLQLHPQLMEMWWPWNSSQA